MDGDFGCSAAYPINGGLCTVRFFKQCNMLNFIV